MDKTETYIRMCKKATEIQEQWIPTRGDFIIGRKLSDSTDSVFVYGDWIEPSDEYESGWSAFDGCCCPSSVVSCGASAKVDDIDFVPSAYLPRQDQLQAMVDLNLKRIQIDVCQERGEQRYIFGAQKAIGDSTEGFSPLYYCVAGNTMEELWLIFVMFEKYDKIWNGEDWVCAST